MIKTFNFIVYQVLLSADSCLSPNELLFSESFLDLQYGISGEDSGLGRCTPIGGVPVLCMLIAIRLWNSIPAPIKSTSSLDHFKSSINHITFRSKY